jgi:hypothetical protein
MILPSSLAGFFFHIMHITSWVTIIEVLWFFPLHSFYPFHCSSYDTIWCVLTHSHQGRVSDDWQTMDRHS